MEEVIGRLIYLIYCWIYYLMVFICNLLAIPVVLYLLYCLFKFIILGEIG